MIKYIKSLAMAVLVLTISVTACKSSKDAMTQEAGKSTYRPLANSLLWKIEGKGLTSPSYLYGTIHIIDADDYYLPEGTLAAIDNTSKMVFEIDMNEMNDMGNMMGLMNKAFMSDGQTLKDLLTATEYELVDAHFQKIGMPLMLLERMKPMFLTVFASGDMDPTGLQNGSMKSYEMEFMEMAQSANKPMAGLETIEFQMSVFDSIPYKAQADMLVETIKMGDTGSDQMKEMVELYRSQNINGMITMITDEGEQLSDYEDILLSKRNEAWISSMKTMMSESPTFFAVGAGHLAGERGVIHLLRQAGYKLTPISGK